MIEVTDVHKVYGRFVAVEGLTFTVGRGQVLALLGPNGAGKSTTIRSITGLVRPTRGRVTVDGIDVQRSPAKAKQRLGYVPDRPYLYPKLTGRELLRFVARLRGVADGDRAADLWLERFDLVKVQNERIEAYSHGMRQKLTFCAAFLHEPSVVVIDEPMVGLDPRAARDVKVLMRDWANAGRTVLLTTHQIDVAEELADDVVVMHRGRLVAQGTMQHLRHAVGNDEARLESIFLMLTEESEAAAESSAAPGRAKRPRVEGRSA